MNRDTVIDLAKQAKVFFDDRKVNYCFYPNQLLEFAALVAAHEREECAKVAMTGTGEAVQIKTLEIIRAERERIANAIRSRD